MPGSSGVTIKFGNTVFSGSALRSVKINQQFSPISDELQISTVDADFEVSANQTFAVGDKAKVKLNNNPCLTAFVREARKTGKTDAGKILWSLKLEDYISKLADAPYSGFAYPDTESGSGFSAWTVLQDIFSEANVPFDIPLLLKTELQNTMLTGVIAATNCRDALLNVAFVCNFSVSTAGDDYVSIFRINPSSIKSIVKGRLRESANDITDESYDAVKLTVYAYRRGDDPQKLYDLSEADMTAGTFTATFADPVFPEAETEIPTKKIGRIKVISSSLNELTISGLNEIEFNPSVQTWAYNANYAPYNLVVYYGDEKLYMFTDYKSAGAWDLSKVEEITEIDGSPVSVFSDSQAYSKDDYVTHVDALYRLTTDKPAGAWSTDYVVEQSSVTIWYPIPEFSEEKTYPSYAYVSYNGRFYQFTEYKSAGAWNPNIVTRNTIAGHVTNIHINGYSFETGTSTVRRANSQAATEKELTVENATLVTNRNSAAIMNRIFSYYTHGNRLQATVIDRASGSGAVPIRYGEGRQYGNASYKTEQVDAGWHYGDFTPYVVSYESETAPINVGDLVTVETEFGGSFAGRVVSSIYDLKSGVIDREIVVREEIIS